MNSEQVSLVAEHPFVRRFVLAILQNVKTKSLVRDERYVVHADLVPKVSAKSLAFRGDRLQMTDNRGLVMPPLVPIRRAIPPPVSIKKVVPQNIVPPQQHIVPPPVKGDVGLSQDYGKIMPLLNDDSVSTIECHGDGKPLMIIRAGQRQPTRIVLSAKEIKEILDEISDAVHIPILEGVFRAAVDNFSINAVVSEIIGSRFVIKRQNAYSMLKS